MMKRLLGLAALTSIAAAPTVAQAAPLLSTAAPVAFQDAAGGDGESNVGYVALAITVVVFIFVGLGISDQDDSGGSVPPRPVSP